jgi:uncharacterized membrane protein
LNMISMSMSLIALILLFIEIIEPEEFYQKVMATDKLLALLIACASGILMGVTNYLNRKTVTMRYEKLQ